tara:strand:- start:4303 stop:4620 length:318 start_codon:yes stop_codon:yes gene_type:complete
MSTDEKKSKELIEYRLDQFENSLSTNFASLNTKLDTLLNKINDSDVKQENLKIRVERIESEISKVNNKQQETDTELVKVKVTIAEKLSWSTLGGLVAAALSKMVG